MKKILQITILMLFITGSMNYIQAAEEEALVHQGQPVAINKSQAYQANVKAQAWAKETAKLPTGKPATTDNLMQQHTTLMEQPSLNHQDKITLQATKVALNARGINLSPTPIAEASVVAAKPGSIEIQPAASSGSVTEKLDQNKVKTNAKTPLFIDDEDKEDDAEKQTDTYLNKTREDRNGTTLTLDQLNQSRQSLFDDTTVSTVVKTAKNSNPSVEKPLDRTSDDILPQVRTNDVLSAKEQEESDKLENSVSSADITIAANNPVAAQTLAENTADQAANQAGLNPQQRQSLKDQARVLMKSISKSSASWFSDFCDKVIQITRQIRYGANKTIGTKFNVTPNLSTKRFDLTDTATSKTAEEQTVYGPKTEAEALADKGMTDDEITADSQARNEPIREEDVQAALQENISDVSAGKTGAVETLAENTVNMIGQKEYGKRVTPEQQAALDKLESEAEADIAKANKTDKNWFQKVYQNIMVKMGYRPDEPVAPAKTLGDKTGLTDDQVNQRQPLAQILNPKAIDTTAQQAPVTTTPRTSNNSTYNWLKSFNKQKPADTPTTNVLTNDNPVQNQFNALKTI